LRVLNRFAGLLCFAGLFFAAVGGFRVVPPHLVMDVSGGQRNAYLEVLHTDGGPVAVEIAIYERKIDIDGMVDATVDSLVKSNDFEVFPAQVVLMPGDNARVQIMYRGRERITADRTYFIHSKEVSLPLPDDGDQSAVRTGITMIVDFLTVMTLETGRPGNLVFVSSGVIGGGEAEIIAENRGNGRYSTAKLRIAIGNDRITEFSGGANYILPGAKRRFTFKYDRAPAAREVRFETN
jgi:P pilus assembly chaperone PapD